jgi:DNA-binding beta-propeller fold protein YncE
MKKPYAFYLVLFLFCRVDLWGQHKPPLELVETIALPGVEGKTDHFGLDPEGQRLFLTLEGTPSVAVFDLKTSKLIHTITGFKKPHAIFVRPDLNKIFVIDGDASEIKVFDGTSYNLVDHIGLTIDADPLLYDPATKYLWVVNGGRDAHTPYCLVSIVDTTTNRKLADIKLDVNRLESMALETGSQRLFISMTASNEIGVIDRQKHTLIAHWPIADTKENVPLSYDEADHRLFTATRTPPNMVVMNADTGKVVAALPIGKSTDDLVYDPVHKRIYSACGEGFITVYQQVDADHYELLGNVPTAVGAKNGIYVQNPERYYIAVPGKGDQPVEIRLYKVVL